MPDKTLRILITGGTLDKTYDQISGQLTFTTSHIQEILTQVRCQQSYVLETVMLKDSLYFDQQDRETILQRCLHCPEKRVLITHGTDSMAQTARLLGRSVQEKTIVLTGAMVPLTFINSDGLFNLGFAFAATRLLQSGVHLAMNGGSSPGTTCARTKIWGSLKPLESPHHTDPANFTLPPESARHVGMSTFPAFLHLTGRRCLVVGAGHVGRRKIRRLILCRAHPVLVVEPHPEESFFQDPAIQARVALVPRSFEPQDLQEVFLVVASTSQAEVNRHIGHLCQEQNILCNVVDQPELCSLTLPSLITRGDLAIAVSTGGASPALARRIRQQLEQEFGEEYTQWTALLRLLRPGILARGTAQTENAVLFRSLTDAEIGQAIFRGDGPHLLACLQARLPSDLHPLAREVLNELDFSL